MKDNPLITYYLEMTDPGQFRAADRELAEAAVRRAVLPCPEINRFFYRTVGKDWQWKERLSWSETRWAEYVGRPELETWIGYLTGTPFGYFELARQPERNVEIAIFGVMPAFVGRGLGGFLLNEAVRNAWLGGARRVWLHTCSYDHPAALANYEARGFALYQTDEEEG